MTTLFTAAGAWAVGDYELALEFRSAPPEAVRVALAALWSHPNVGGCYARKDVEPDEQTEVDADVLHASNQLYGSCVLPNRERVAARSLVIAYESGPMSLYFGLPLGSLGRAYSSGAFPFADGTPLQWRNDVDAWLRRIAADIYTRVRFDLGLIGFDPPDHLSETIERDGIPSHRWEGYLVPKGDELAWFPPTEGAPLTVDR